MIGWHRDVVDYFGNTIARIAGAFVKGGIMQGLLSFPVNAFLITSFLLLTAFPLFAQAPTDRPEVYRDIYHDTSAPAYAYTNAPPMDSVQRRVRPIEHRHAPGMLPTAPDRAT